MNSPDQRRLVEGIQTVAIRGGAEGLVALCLERASHALVRSLFVGALQGFTADTARVQVAADERGDLCASRLLWAEGNIQVVHVAGGRLEAGQGCFRQGLEVACGYGHEGADWRESRLSLTVGRFYDSVEQVALNALDQGEIFDQKNDLFALPTVGLSHLLHGIQKPARSQVSGALDGGFEMSVE